MWLLIEEFLIAFVMLVFVTQIMMPVLMNKPIFPLKRWRKITKMKATRMDQEDLKDYLDSMVESDEGVEASKEKKDGYEQSSGE